MTPIAQAPGSELNPTLDFSQADLMPYLSSQAVLIQSIRECILDRTLDRIDYKPGDIEDLPEDIAKATLRIRRYKIDKFKAQTWGKQLESYFLQRKDALNQVVHSMIRTPDAGLTQELYFRLQAQEATFADLAQAYSQGPESLTNGIIGPKAMAQLPPQIAQKLASMQPGKISTPIPFQGHFVILKLERWIPARLNEATEQMLLHEQFEVWLQEQINQKLSQFLSSEKSCNVLMLPVDLAS